LLAASASFAPAQVRLKWIDEGYFEQTPTYLLFRKGPGETEFSKIADPLTEDPTFTLAIKDHLGKPQIINLKDRLSLAHKAIKNDPNIFMFSSKVVDIQPSKDAFVALRQWQQQRFAPLQGRTRRLDTMPQLPTAPALTDYLQRINNAANTGRTLTPAQTNPLIHPNITGGVSAPRVVMPLGGGMISTITTPKTRIMIPMPTIEQQVLEMRSQLTLGALVNQDLNKSMGLGYIDTQVKAGGTYQYELRLVQPDAVSTRTMASCEITVGADPKPAIPQGLQVMQRNAYKTCLRWTLDETKTNARAISYDLFRTVNGTTKQLNPQPLTIGMLETSDGGLLDPIWYVEDADVPIGAVQYSLVGHDTFGRDTPTATTTFTMQDWTRPLAPGSISGKTENGKAVLTWLPPRKQNADHTAPITSPDTQAAFMIYRQDIELQRAAAPDKPPKIGPAKLSPTFHQESALAHFLFGIGAPVSGRLSGVWERVHDDPIPFITLTKGAVDEKAICIFTDTTATPDHHYRYCVMAVYPKNMLDSDPGPAVDVDVPDLAKPPSPATFAGNCTPLVTPPTGKVSLVFESTLLTTPRVATTVASKVLGLNTDALAFKKASSNTNIEHIGIAAKGYVLPTVVNSDLGASVNLTWKESPLTAPVRYRVYRAIASGYFAAAASAPEKAKTENAASAATPASGGKASVAALTHSTLTIAGKGYAYYQKIDPDLLDPRDYVLVGEINGTSFIDNLPKSRPMHYVYKVTVVNRWGVEGIGARVEVRVPGTLKPPTPQLVYAHPNEQGSVTVGWKPLASQEEVAKYLIFRKQLDMSKIIKAVANVIGQAPAPASSSFSSFAGLSLAGNATMQPFSGGDKPATAVMSPALQKMQKVNIQRLPIMPVGDPQFRARLFDEMLAANYGSNGVAAPDALDIDGNVRFVDPEVLSPVGWYSYTVVALDADGWQSDAGKPLVSTALDMTSKPVTNLKAKMADAGEPPKYGVELTWSLPAEKISSVTVKRATNNGEYAQIASLLLDDLTSFTDYGVMRGVSYSYQVNAIDGIGNLSPPVTVKITTPGY